MSVRENANTMLSRAARIGALRRATVLAGQADIASGLGCTVRNLQQKMDADRGLDARLLGGAAAVLERKATEMVEHAAKLRVLAGEKP